MASRSSGDVSAASEREEDPLDEESLTAHEGTPSLGEPWRREANTRHTTAQRCAQQRQCSTSQAAGASASPPQGCRRCSHLRRPAGVVLALLAVHAVFRLGSPGSDRPPAQPLHGDALPPGRVEEALELTSFPQLPSLFCFIVMLSGGEEEALVRTQLSSSTSLFACDMHVIFTNESRLLGSTPKGAQVWTWAIPMPLSHMTNQVMNGQVVTAYTNARTFIVAWDALLAQGGLWQHDWTVKVDPDTVFFPDRLLLHLCAHKGQTLYFTNCRPTKTASPTMLGSLEVYSIDAIKNYAANKERCKSNANWLGQPENAFMQSCMDLLGVVHTFDSSLLGDSSCSPVDCSDWTRVSFHPYKDVESYMECYRSAMVLEDTVD